MTDRYDKKEDIKIGVVILNFILVVLFLIGLFVGFSLLPIKGNYKLMSVLSGSMKPTIDTGELIVIKPAQEYKVGDIITFKNISASREKSTTHRITEIRISEDRVEYKVKGDANDASDSNLVNKNDVLGKYLVGIRYLGYIIGFAKTLPGLVLIIIIPAVIIVYEEVKKIHKESKAILEKRRAKKFKKN